MFEYLFAFSVIVTLLVAFFYFRTGNSNTSVIKTKLDSLNQILCDEQENDEFQCDFKHDLQKEEILVFPSSNLETELDKKLLGSVPYKYKSKILHYMNTEFHSYTAVFNKTTKEISIDLITEHEDKS